MLTTAGVDFFNNVVYGRVRRLKWILIYSYVIHIKVIGATSNVGGVVVRCLDSPKGRLVATQVQSLSQTGFTTTLLSCLRADRLVDFPRIGVGL